MNIILSPRVLLVLRKTTIGLLYFILLTPLLLSARFFFPYISTKVFYFRLLVEIAFALYIILAVADPTARPQRHPLIIAAGVFFGIVVVTSIFGLNPYRSFWGNAERGEGLLTLAHVMALFVIMTGVLRDWSAWRRFFAVAVGVSFLSALYATTQKLCGSSESGVCSVIRVGDLGRVSALIGNAAFYAGYLLMNVFLALWLLLESRARWQRLIYAGVIVYELLIINLTRTRGALLALFISFVIGLIVLAWRSPQRRLRRRIAAGLVVFGLAAVLVFSFRDSDLIHNNTAGLSSLTHISEDDVTLESRLLTWQASWRGWRERLFAGYGYENFNIAFNKYFPPAIFRDSGSQIWFDRAHNVFFELAVTTGLFGVAGYLLLFGLSFYFLFFRRGKGPPPGAAGLGTAIIFSTLLVAYFIQNLFVFDTLGTYTLFYSVLAFVIYLTPRSSPPNPTASAHRPAINVAVLAGVLVALIITAYTAVIKPARANVLITEALVAAGEHRFQDTLATYRRIIALDTYMNEEARQKLAETMISLRGEPSVSRDAKNQGFRYAIEEMKQAVAAAPSDARNYLYLIALYNALPSPEAGSADEVIRLGKKALALSPTRPQIYFEMGQAAILLGPSRFEEALGYFKTAVALNANTSQQRVPAESRWNLALAYALTGHADQAEEQVDTIYAQERISKISDGNLRNLIQFYEKISLFKNTLRLYRTLLERHPEDVVLHAELAQTYGTLCLLTEAQTEVAAVVKLKPDEAGGGQALLRRFTEACKK